MPRFAPLPDRRPAIVAGALAVYISTYGPLDRSKILDLMSAGTLAGPRSDSSKAYSFKLK